jgi:hypothetical protein
MAGEHVGGVDPEFVPPDSIGHQQCISEAGQTRFGLEYGSDHQGAFLILTGNGQQLAGGDREVSCFLVEDAGKDGRAVEAGGTPPMDRAVTIHEGG